MCFESDILHTSFGTRCCQTSLDLKWFKEGLRDKVLLMGFLIMKKSLLSLAIASVVAVAATSASAATIYEKDGSSIDAYGRVMAVFYSQNYDGNNGLNEANDGNFNSSSRLGFNFRSEINQYMAAIANVEWEMAAENGTTQSRYTWVGADFGQFGLVKVGKFEDAVKYVIETTDIFEDAGCRGQLGNDDRRSGMFGYYWSGWGVDANVTVGTAKDDQHVDGAFWTDSEPGDDSSEEEADIKLSYALSLGYTTPDVLFGPISIRAGWGAAYFEDENAGDPDPKAYDGNVYDQYGQWAASITWGNLSDGLYLSVMGQNRNFELFGLGANLGSLGAYANEYDVTGVEFVVAYGFANGVTLMTGYEWQQIDYDFSTPTDLDSDAKSSVIPVLAQWQINPNIKIWAEARFDAGTDDEYADYSNGVYSYNDENVFALGAKYTF